MATATLSTRPRSYELAFEDLLVAVGKKTILDNVTGVAEPSSMLAVMGPSGAGKTTLLNTLAGRSIPLVSGSIRLNDQPLSKQLRRKISYVLQDDIFCPNLTVRDTLTYTAWLRLPDSMPAQHKLARIQEVVDAVGIRKCLDTVIGGPMLTGISGGEKKRTSIACELLTNPTLLLLDEPTSGLDSSIAHDLMMTLKKHIMNSGKTVIASIHQPSNQTFFLFDKVLLLCEGQVAYFGDCNGMVNYFACLGLYNQPNYNPADFMLDTVSNAGTKGIVLKAATSRRHNKGKSQNPEPHGTGHEPSANLRENSAGLFHGDGMMLSTAAQDEMPTGNAQSFKVTITGAVQISFRSSSAALCELSAEDSYYEEHSGKWPTSFWTQYCLLSKRNFKDSLPEIMSIWNCIQMLLVSVFCGLLWFQLTDSEDSIEKRQGISFFQNTFWGFELAINALLAFSAERALINKERAAGYYRLSAYYFAKMTSELPLTLLLPSIFITIVFWMAHLGDYVAFFKNWGIMLLSAFTAQSIGLFLGAAVVNLKMALTAVNMFMLLTVLAAGFYVKEVPNWLEWTKYVSYVHYSFSAIISIQFSSVQLSCLPENRTAYCAAVYSALRDLGDGTVNHSSITLSDRVAMTCQADLNGGATLPGCVVLDSLHVYWPEWAYPLMLISISFVLRLLTYITLRFVRMPK